MKCSCDHEHNNTVEVNKIDELANIDIKSEMELIKQRKSRLSANQRKEVEIRYNKLVEAK